MTNETSGYEWIRARVNSESIALMYRVNGLPRDGSHRIEGDDYSDWSDDDIRAEICRELDIDERFADKIEIEHD